jgi:hypothetical protein
MPFHIKYLRHINYAWEADTAHIIGHALASYRLDNANYFPFKES